MEDVRWLAPNAARTALRLAVWAMAAILSCGPDSRAADAPFSGQAALSYGGYTLLLHVARLAVEFRLEPSGYDVRLHSTTTGLLSLFVSADATTQAHGVWNGNEAEPRSFSSSGLHRGAPRRVVLRYRDHRPHVDKLEPADDDRSPVPPALTNGTVDPLSAIVQLIRRVSLTGRCDGSALVFDGRRLFRVTARSAGQETLLPSRRSSYAGPALRCELTGQVLAGFKRSAGAEARAVKHGTAWFARLTAGGPAWPVRATVETPWVGQVRTYVQSGAP